MVHGDHLQSIPVHSPQVMHQAAAGGRFHYVVGHSLSDLHSLQEVGDKQEFGEEVLTLRHGGCVLGWWMDGGRNRNKEEERRRRRRHQPPAKQRGNWKERRGVDVITEQSTFEIIVQTGGKFSVENPLSH